MAAVSNAKDTNWWRGAVIYQIYPRTFQDTNGDGVGDLPGITRAAADYIAEPRRRRDLDLAVLQVADGTTSATTSRTTATSIRCSARWPTSTRCSPRRIALGLKVMIDQVLSRTPPIEHAWFKRKPREPRQSRRPTGTSGPMRKPTARRRTTGCRCSAAAAWQWEPRRHQYYLHNFLTAQPDLNFHNPEVQQATLDNVQFWLDRGVDGLRLDAINFCFHDRAAARQPGLPPELRTGRGFSADNPYAYPVPSITTIRSRKILRFLERLRALMDRLPRRRASLGEISATSQTRSRRRPSTRTDGD